MIKVTNVEERGQIWHKYCKELLGKFPRIIENEEISRNVYRE